MANSEMLKRVASALSAVVHPGTGKDLVLSGMVKELRDEGDGHVRFRLVMPAGGPADLLEQARRAAERVEGVSRVTVDAETPGGAAGPQPAAARGGRRPLPVVGARRPGAGGAGAGAAPGGGGGGGGGRPGAGPRPGGGPPPTPEPLPGVSRVIAVSSGKGGVGKSTVSTNLACALTKAGHRVGLLDADVYGPNIPLMFGVRDRPRVRDERVIPLEGHGVKLMSMGFLIEEEMPAIWRGPIVMGVIRQFLQQVEWGELDYLVVDMPPGTGDAQLSLVQLVRVDGGILVTTPQDVSVGDVLKAVKMFERVEVPVLGVIENMSGFVCPHCGEETDLFGRGGGKRLAERAGVPFLGAVPFGASVVGSGDRGRPTVLDAPESPEGRAFQAVAEKVAAAVEARLPGRAGSG